MSLYPNVLINTTGERWEDGEWSTITGFLSISHYVPSYSGGQPQIELTVRDERERITGRYTFILTEGATNVNLTGISDMLTAFTKAQARAEAKAELAAAAEQVG